MQWSAKTYCQGCKAFIIFPQTKRVGAENFVQCKKHRIPTWMPKIELVKYIDVKHGNIRNVYIGKISYKTSVEISTYKYFFFAILASLRNVKFLYTFKKELMYVFFSRFHCSLMLFIV